MQAIDASETSAELADIGVVLARSYTEQKLSAEDYQDAAEKLREKLRELKEAAKATSTGFQSISNDGDEAFAGITQSAGNAQSVTGMMANHINGITQELHALSPAAEKAFHAMNQDNSTEGIRNTGGAIEHLRQQLDDARQKADELSQSMGTPGSHGDQRLVQQNGDCRRGHQGSISGTEDCLYRTHASLAGR